MFGEEKGTEQEQSIFVPWVDRLMVNRAAPDREFRVQVLVGLPPR